MMPSNQNSQDNPFDGIDISETGEVRVRKPEVGNEPPPPDFHEDQVYVDHDKGYIYVPKDPSKLAQVYTPCRPDTHDFEETGPGDIAGTVELKCRNCPEGRMVRQPLTRG